MKRSQYLVLSAALIPVVVFGVHAAQDEPPHIATHSTSGRFQLLNGESAYGSKNDDGTLSFVGWRKVILKIDSETGDSWMLEIIPASISNKGQETKQYTWVRVEPQNNQKSGKQ